MTVDISRRLQVWAFSSSEVGQTSRTRFLHFNKIARCISINTAMAILYDRPIGTVITGPNEAC